MKDAPVVGQGCKHKHLKCYSFEALSSAYKHLLLHRIVLMLPLKYYEESTYLFNEPRTVCRVK